MLRICETAIVSRIKRHAILSNDYTRRTKTINIIFVTNRYFLLYEITGNGYIAL